MILLGIMILAAVTDVSTGKIRNRLILVGLFLGLTITIYEAGAGVVPFWFLKISIPVILLFLLFRIGTLGAGDIKLFSVMAGFLTLKELKVCAVAAFLAGAVFGIGKLFLARKAEKPHTIHFSVPMLAGYLYYLGVMN